MKVPAAVSVTVVLGVACAALSWWMWGHGVGNWMAPVAFWAGTFVFVVVSDRS